MKKLLTLLLAAAMLLSMASCAETGEPSDPILGTVSGNTYTNTYFGMGCTLDESWLVADEEQMLEIMSITGDMLTDAALESDGIGYSFYASKDDGLTSLNIVMENLGKLYGMFLSEQEYAEIAVERLPATFEPLGMTEIVTEITSIDFAGSSHTAVRVSGNLYGASFYTTVVCMKQDSYIAVVTAASYFEDTTEEILAMFEAA